MPYKHITISEFKAEAKAEAVQIVRSPITSKLFVAVGDDRYKVQGKDHRNGELDVTKPIHFMMEVGGTEDKPEPHTEDQFKEGCFINGNADNVVLSL
jgi:hypothetical protein